MYKLVIVDDEQDVRLRLKSLVEKSELSFEIVGMYENGIEAYDGILSVAPDLVVTDIKIPYIDGLETLKRVIEVFPLIKSIVITGFDEFDYAKQAANLGVIGFISKPISLDDLKSVLTKAAAELDREFSLSENIKQLEDFHQKNLPLIRENNLCRLLAMSELSDAFKHKLGQDGIDLDFRYMLLAVADFDHIDMDIEAYDTAFTSIKKEFDEHKYRHAEVNVFVKSEQLYVLLKSNEPLRMAEVENIFSVIILKIKRYFSLSLSVGISDIRDCPHCGFNFKQMNANALKALEYRTMMGDNKVFLFDNVKSAVGTGIGIGEGEYNELAYTVKHKSEAEASQYLDELRKKIAADKFPLSYYYIISNILNSIINSCNDVEALFSQYVAYDDIYKRIFSLKSADNVFVSLQHLLTIVRRVNDESIRKSLDGNLTKILQYISVNYRDERLCMESLSADVGLSVSYISTLLKKENTSFVKYLTSLRMEKAKELLRQTTRRIMEISEQLGYSDPYYFSHCFKKHSGMSPKEYREYEEK